ncbi:hypothetical protein BHE74_00012539 [Ensete ventricosum]|nr:hypothetical protein BHE74_00012539 [Ensete ventricosum]
MLDELGKGLLTPLAQAGERGGSGLRCALTKFTKSEERESSLGAVGVEPQGWLTDRVTVMLGVTDLTAVPVGLVPRREGRSSVPQPPKSVGACESLRRDVLHSYCSEGALAKAGPPSSAKNVVGYYAVARESAWLGPARVRKVVRIGRESGEQTRGRSAGSSDVRLGMLLLGVLHEGLVGVGCPMWPLRRLSQCPDRGSDLNIVGSCRARSTTGMVLCL